MFLLKVLQIIMLVFIRLQGPVWNICFPIRCQHSDSLDTEMYSIPLSLPGLFYFLSVGIWGWEIVCCGGCPLIGYNSISILCLPLTVAPLHAFLVVLAKNVSNCSYMFLGWLRMWNLTERGLSKISWLRDMAYMKCWHCFFSCSGLSVLSSACLICLSVLSSAVLTASHMLSLHHSAHLTVFHVFVSW